MGAEQSHLEELAVSGYHQGRITFFINGIEYNVTTDGCDPEIGPQYLLVDYIRDKLPGLTGTKYMCREGGCGACIVSVRSLHPVTGKDVIASANSCLLPLFACDGLDITTVEGLGNRKVGYDRIQQRLVKFGGTQCGFCTPGFVMTMHSVAQSNPRFTTSDVEYALDGNICRCTGFRPIVDAFKSLAVNASEELKLKCQDIEEAHKCPMKAVFSGTEEEKPEIIQLPRKIHLKGSSGEQWFKVTSLPTLFDIIERFTVSKALYRLVAGNTGTGVYRNDGPYQGFVEVNDVAELHYTELDQSGLVLGGGVNLTETMSMLDRASRIEGFIYAHEFHEHFRKIGSTSVRNRGTLAGNIMLKHLHREFGSDIFTLFASIGATMRVASTPTISREYKLEEFLDLDMNGKVILSFHLPTFTGNYFYKSMRLGKRFQNSAAFVNAGCLFNIEPKTLAVLDRPLICYGGISPFFIHARRTEDYLIGKQLNVATLQGALLSLQREIQPDHMSDTSPEYRLGLAQSFLYRALLGIRGKSVNTRLRSGAEEIPRGNSTGKQIYDSDRTKWPLYQPIPKLESFPQTSGEAQFVNDIRPERDELFGVFVLATVANATIKYIDAAEALMTPGVVAFITAKDIPGNNNHAIFLTQREEIFIESQVRYAGQPVGLLVATNKYVAFGARSKVIVKYDNLKPPVIDIREAVKRKQESKLESGEEPNLAFPCRGINAQTAKQWMMNAAATSVEPFDEKELKGGLHKLKGTFVTHSQYHFHMETQICVCVPNEDGMEVYSATQHMDAIQASIAGCLSVPVNSITVHVRRLGGAFGGKISKACHVATATAIAAYVTHRPVRVALDMETNMHMIGKRLPYLVNYEAGVDDNGKIYKLDADIYCDGGVVINEPTSLYASLCMQSSYRANGWNLRPHSVPTDTSPNTYCRKLLHLTKLKSILNHACNHHKMT